MDIADTPHVRHADVAPDFLAIGHVTRDLLPDGSWRLGGTVTFAALTAARLGLRAAIVTSAPTDVLAALNAALPDTTVSVVPSEEATAFENIYSSSGRQQYLRGRAAPLTIEAVPPRWRDAPIVLLAPVAQEVDTSLVTAFPRSLVGATPQGWLRQWDGDGKVTPAPLSHAETLLPHAQALILSRDDVPSPVTTDGEPAGDPEIPEIPAAPEAFDGVFFEWARTVPQVAVTAGKDGVLLIGKDMPGPMMLSGYPAREVDPTGAGDVFAAAFLTELHPTGDAARAADFANRVAACSVEAPGGDGIPTREMLAARWGLPGDPDNMD